MTVSALITSVVLLAAADGSSPRQQFAERAWTLEESAALAGLSVPRAFSRQVRVLDVHGDPVDTALVLELAVDADERAAVENTGGTRRTIVIVLSILSTVMPVAGTVPGLLLGGLAGGAWGWWLSGQPSSGDPNSARMPLPLGLAFGGLVGAGIGAFAMLPVQFVALQFAGNLLDVKPPRVPLGAMVRRHNLQLAAELGVDPATLDPRYFPAPPPAPARTKDRS